MKRFLVNLMAVLMVVALCVGFSACEQIRTLTVTVDVYQGQDASPAYKSYEIKFDLYRHLAPKTVDHIQQLVKDGYYESAIFYRYAENNTEQLMLGDYVYDNTRTDDLKFSENTKDKTYVKGEFEKGGVTGSDLVNEKYSIGLWRIFDSNTTNYGGSAVKVDGVDSVYDSGSASVYMPTSANSSFNGYFCVFGKIVDTDSKENFDKVITALSDSAYYSSYTVFWTGTDKDNLTKHIMLTQRFEDGKDNGTITDVFDPSEEGQLREVKENYYIYKPYTINVLQENRRVVVSNISVK